jgi:hypothetical protein
VSILTNVAGSENYLKNLADCHSKLENANYKKNIISNCYNFRTVKLASDLARFDMGSDNSYLNMLTTKTFQRYLDTYIM